MEPGVWNDLELLNLAEERNGGRYPPRFLFGKGVLAAGQFQPYMPLSDYTEADFLCDPYQSTPTMVRFSLATGSAGSGDTQRDLRAMEVKLYTREGNCDLISFSLPEGICRDGRDFFKLSDDLRTGDGMGLRDQCGYLRYAADHPQAFSGILRLHGKWGIPASYTSMESWAAGTMLWRGKQGRMYFVRHRWVPETTPKYLSENEGEFLCGFDPDNTTRKLYNELAEGRTATFELRLHLIPAEQCSGGEEIYCNPTLAWPEDSGIQLRAGRLILDRIPERAIRQEQVFCCSPDSLVTGMAIPEGSFLHQMAVAVRTLQGARLGEQRTKAAVNSHYCRQRPAVCPRVERIGGRKESAGMSVTDAREKIEGPALMKRYCQQARDVWHKYSEAEKEAVAKSVAQRLLFGAPELRVKLLQQMEEIEPQLVSFIEKQLTF